MATCREVITAALKQLRVVYPGRAASDDEAVDGLASLQSYYDELIGSGGFGRLEEVRISADYEAEENQRIYNAEDTTYTVTLPEYIEDADAENGRRPPKDRSLVVVVGATTAAYVYSAPSGAWQALGGLTLNSTAPLSERSLSGLAAVLAMRLSPEYGKAIHPETARQAARFSSLISTKLDGPYQATEATYF